MASSKAKRHGGEGRTMTHKDMYDGRTKWCPHLLNERQRAQARTPQNSVFFPSGKSKVEIFGRVAPALRGKLELFKVLLLLLLLGVGRAEAVGISVVVEMISSPGLDFYAVCTYAAGVAGNLFAFVLFVSPIPTFRRIVRNQSTESFSGLPYIYALLNCLICFWYGLPCVSHGVILVATVNSIGAVFQLFYITLFIIYASYDKRLKISALLIAVFATFAVIVYISLELLEPSTRQIVVGYLSVASLISMFASPLFIINLVIRTRSVEFMPFYLSLSTFLMSISFFAYGMLLHDYFIYIPNGIGTILGAVQLLLYANYSKSEREDRLPLLASY